MNEFLSVSKSLEIQELSKDVEIDQPQVDSSNQNNEFALIQWLGLLIWVSGFLIEVVSDTQKSKFNKKNKGEFIDVGLWKYIRHPNYLGEIIIWFGIFVISISYINSIFTFLSIFSPIFVFVLLRFLSGVPQLEQRG